jgi:hypothetical protein
VSKCDLKLDWATHEAAKYAVENWHYSGCMPRFKSVKIGVWEDMKFIGCLVFADGANNNMLRPYGLQYHEGCELVRVALTKHKTQVTRLISISFIFLKQKFPEFRLILSYADPDQGHHGGIYQGGNWIYAGQTEPADEYIVNGRKMHGKALRQSRSSHRFGKVKSANVFEWCRKFIDPNAEKVIGSRKHRYLMPLDTEMRVKILPLARPYPKRAGSDTTDTAPFQGAKGGSIPTPALHLQTA